MMPRLAPCYNDAVNAKERAELMRMLGTADERTLDVYQIAMELRRAQLHEAKLAAKRGLPPRGDYDTLKTHMDLAQEQATKKRRGRPMLSEHPFPRRLEALGLTVRDVIADLRANHGLVVRRASTVRSWYAEGRDGRSIPERFVKAFQGKPYLIPRSAWVNGITD